MLSASLEVLNIIRSQGKGKETRMVGGNLTFIKKEARKPVHPYYYGLVFTLQVTNNRIHRVLIDTRRLVDILFIDA